MIAVLHASTRHYYYLQVSRLLGEEQQALRDITCFLRRIRQKSDNLTVTHLDDDLPFLCLSSDTEWRADAGFASPERYAWRTSIARELYRIHGRAVKDDLILQGLQ